MNGVVGRGGRSPGRIFFRRYKGLAAGVAVVLLVFVGAANWLLIDRRIVAESEHQAVALARGIASYELAGLLVRSSQSGRMQLDDEEAADLRARLSRFMPHFGLREIRLLDRDGRTVFCDLIGPPHAFLLTSEELQAALHGRVVSRMHEHRDPETGPDHIDAVLTAIPLRDRDGVVIGVMNLCGDVGDHVAAARTTRYLLLASLALIVLLAYLVKTAQVGRLCRDFDVATDALETSHDKLAAANRDLARSNVRLVAAEAEARVADEAKTAFLATMSHEMRTPLTAILGYLDLCAESRIEPVQRREHVAGLRRNTEHLLGLIENLLDVTELHRAQTSPLLAAGSVTALVGEAVAALRDRASAAGLEVMVRWLTAVPATVTTDHDRVRQALLKLLDNAVKFSHQGEVELEVAYRHDGGDGDRPQLVFHVLDRGCGLPSAIRDDPGQAFRLGDHAANRSHGGSGLGLHIARTVAELLDGGLTAHDRPGGGAHLELRIGLAGVSDSLIRPAGTFGPEDAAPAPPPKPARTDLTGVRVLYAEDGPDNQFLVKAILGRAGALVDIAQNGAEALEMAADAEYDYDVILMDIQMPVMDGLEATRTLRARGYGGPIFALTANAMEADRIDSAAAGCDRHLTKPINRRLLLSSVAESSLAAS